MEPEQLSDWTVRTLHEHVQRMIEAEHRWIEAKLAAVVDAMEAMHLASDKALSKAEHASEKRFESVNEFRGQLSDQINRFLTKSEYEAHHIDLERRTLAIERFVSENRGQLSRTDTMKRDIFSVIGTAIALVAAFGAVALVFWGRP